LKSKKRARSRRTGVVLAAGSAGSLLFLGLAAPAGAATHPAKIAVSQGLGAAALQGSTVYGSTPADTPETVSFVLDPRNLAGLEASVQAGMPGGFLSVSQFARAFGQTSSNISALRQYLARFGIASTAYADGLNVNATGTAGEFDSALSVQQNQYKIPAVAPSNRNGYAGHQAMTIHATAQTPLLPASLGSFVLSVLGLDNYPTDASQSVRAPESVISHSASTVQNGNLTAADFAKQYGINPLYRKGATGAGETIGIVTLASFYPADAETYWSTMMGISTPANRITIDNIDGGSGPVSDAAGSGETTIDVEQSGGVAPDANIDVYEAPNADPGFTDAWYTAASQNVADTVSTSWGEAEDVINSEVATGVEDPNYQESFDNAFLEMAAQGQSTFVAQGDAGAYDDSDELGTTDLNVDSPGDSPWTTSAGGTTLAGIQEFSGFNITIPAQRAWGWDYLFPYWSQLGAPSEAALAESAAAGGGGGFSTFEPTPLYQDEVSGTHHYSAVPWFTPTDPVAQNGIDEPTEWNFNPAPSVVSGFGSGRATPDVSADADPDTGYTTYFSGYPSGGPVEGFWGGTSFVAPQFNGATAVIDSYLGHRIGLWNTSIYQFANLANSPVTPLGAAGTSNDNLYYTGTPGQTYNVGTGLGTPDFSKLANDFAKYGG
jgi:kumamolisin